MSDATDSVTMLTASTRQDRFLLTACRIGAQAADDARASIALQSAHLPRVLPSCSAPDALVRTRSVRVRTRLSHAASASQARFLLNDHKTETAR